MTNLTSVLLAIPLLTMPSGCAPAAATSTMEQPVKAVLREQNKRCLVEIFYDGKAQLHEIPLINCRT